MKHIFRLSVLLFFINLLLTVQHAYAQPCTTLGQTPSTAFPVCGTTKFTQNTVPLCKTNSIFVPGCSVGAGSANYENKNPFFYKFTCYVSGTLGFAITPLAVNEDYDWQLYDITGVSPNDIFSNNSLVVTGNWAGTYGPTGASAAGTGGIQCASDPAANAPTFAKMPALIAGHQYLLMISHFTDTQSGYDLSFGGGTADITDPLKPHLIKVVPDCDGKSITLTLTKKISCNSITASGSEFSLLPATGVVSAVTDSCAFGFEFKNVVITLNTALTSGTHQLIINKGTDSTTLLDICGNAIPDGEIISFDYIIPRPILADSVRKSTCATDSVILYYPKKIKCSTISPSGSDFLVTGPSSVTVVSATGNCINDLTDYVVVKFAAPIYTKGNFTLSIQPGIDGSPIFDVCGQPILPQSLNFITADTVNADFTYASAYGCQRDTFVFSHNGGHDVNKWNWVFNNTLTASTQNHTIIFPATSSNQIKLFVSNGVCTDSAAATVVLNNEIKTSFRMDPVICPEDKLTVTNTSSGQIDTWRWTFDVPGTSYVKDPPPFLFPAIHKEAYYTVKLVGTNTTLGCSDSTHKTVTVLDFCLIDIPTAFTPNNDGLNDRFGPHNALKADNYEFKIYNRWGQLVFQSRNWQVKWDGKINGTEQTSGVFVWMLRYNNRDTKQPVFRKGTVTVIR